MGGIRPVVGACLLEEGFGLPDEASAQLGLRLDQLGHLIAVLAELVLDRDHGGAGDDQGRPRLIDQDGVNLVDDCEVMAALNLLLLAGGHAVVAEVVEPELGIRPVSDVLGVHLATQGRRLIVEDATDRQAKELVDVPHPLRVTGSEVVIDRDDMDSPTGECVEVDGEGRDEGLAFAGGHFGDLARMQRHATDQLHVERNHRPGELVPPHDDFRAVQSAAGIADHGECLGKDGVQFNPEFGVVLDGRELGLPFGGLGAEGVVRQRFELFSELVDLRYDLPEATNLTVVAGAEDLLDEQTDHERPYCERAGS